MNNYNIIKEIINTNFNCRVKYLFSQACYMDAFGCYNITVITILQLFVIRQARYITAELCRRILN